MVGTEAIGNVVGVVLVVVVMLVELDETVAVTLPLLEPVPDAMAGPDADGVAAAARRNRGPREARKPNKGQQACSSEPHSVCCTSKYLPRPLDAGALPLAAACVDATVFWAKTVAQRVTNTSARHWRILER